MEHKNILNLSNEPSDSKFVARKWNIVNDQSNANYDLDKGIVYNTDVLKSNLCDYNNASILLRRDIHSSSYNTSIIQKFCIIYRMYHKN